MGPAAFVFGIWCNLDVARPVASPGALPGKNFLCIRASIKFPNSSNRVRSTNMEDLRAGDPFSDCFGATLGDSVNFFAILDLRRPLEGLSRKPGREWRGGSFGGSAKDAHGE